MPSGAEVLLGALADPAHAGAGPEYGITHVRLGGGERVWLDSLVGRVEAGRQPRWRVVDELRLPPMPAGHDLVAQLCSVGGVADYGVIAIARRDTAPVLADIRSAWRADLAARRFRSLAPDGVTCVNEGYGV